jgi:hypothetical protein
MVWKILLVVLGTLFAVFVATQLWGVFLYRNLPGGPGIAGDISPVLHSPFYWVMVAVIFIAAGWLLKYWLHVPKR